MDITQTKKLKEMDKEYDCMKKLVVNLQRLYELTSEYVLYRYR